MVDLNATQAAIRAGYSAKTAKEMGAENLTKPLIQAAIQARQLALQVKVEVKQETVLRELIRIGFSDMRQIAQWDENGLILHDSADLTDDAALAIQEVSCIKKTRTYGGEDKDPVIVEEVQTKAKLYSKLDALEKLGRHLGLFKDRLDIGNAEGAPFQVQMVRYDDSNSV